MIIHPGQIQCSELQAQALINLPYRPCPSFLGNFSFRMFKGPEGLPQPINDLADTLAELLPSQQFNTLFVQRYETGQFVKPHRDPMNNIGHTLIAIFGRFEGAISTVLDQQFSLKHGDVLQLECTINGIQGPRHEVSPVTAGTRYAVILNTIV